MLRQSVPQPGLAYLLLRALPGASGAFRELASRLGRETRARAGAVARHAAAKRSPQPSRDAGERGAAECLLRHGAMLQSAIGAMAVCDLDGACLDCNEPFAALFATTRRSLIGVRMETLCAEVHAAPSDSRPGPHPSFRVTFRRADGTCFVRETTTRAIRALADPAAGHPPMRQAPIGHVIALRAVEGAKPMRAKPSNAGLADITREAHAEFLARATHELRTPLNAILGFSDMMREEVFGPLGDRRYREYANDIHVSGALLLELVDDLNALARSDSGHLTLREGEVDLRRLVGDCTRIVGVRAQTKGVRLTSFVARDAARLWGDERRIRQILINLLTNAVKFTPAGGRISVRAEALASGGVELHVRDSGAGIPSDEQAAVLEPFVQGRHARPPGEDEGTGMGLSIVKSFVEAHGGHVLLESAVGAGTTVRVIFPPERAIMPAAA